MARRVSDTFGNTQRQRDDRNDGQVSRTTQGHRDAGNDELVSRTTSRKVRESVVVLAVHSTCGFGTKSKEIVVFVACYECV